MKLLGYLKGEDAFTQKDGLEGLQKWVEWNRRKPEIYSEGAYENPALDPAPTKHFATTRKLYSECGYLPDG